MSEEKICPIMTLKSQTPVGAFKCAREGCAWWCEKKQMCAVAVVEKSK